MLRSLKDLEHYTLYASDGEIGTVVNFLLDDASWTVRYLVAETNGNSGGRDVLITPLAFREVDWATRCFRLALTRDKVRNSPGIDTNQPVSRQHELDYHRYFGYAHYWGGSGIWGSGTYPTMLAGGMWDEAEASSLGQDVDRPGDRHLRSAAEVRGYHIQGTDGPIGHIIDFIVDDETWEVRYLVIDTTNGWFGKKVLVEPRWAREVSWEDGKIHFDLTRKAINDSPPWNPTAAINRKYEVQLYDYYGRPVYWHTEAVLECAAPPVGPVI